MRRPPLRRPAQLVVAAVLTSATIGAGFLREEPAPPPVLPAVVVSPPETRLVIRAAADHYGIERDLAALIHDAAVEEGVDPRLAFALVRVESRFQPRAVGPAGALGLTQLMPATARGLDPGVDREELFEPDTNLKLGMRYLRWLLDHYDGDRRLALTAYNRGPGTVARVRAAGEDPDNGYARRVIDRRAPLPGLAADTRRK